MPEPEQPLSWMARLKGAFARDEPTAIPGVKDDPRRTAASEARVLNAARFDSLRVEDVMAPRADIIAVRSTRRSASSLGCSSRRGTRACRSIGRRSTSRSG